MGMQIHILNVLKSHCITFPLLIKILKLSHIFYIQTLCLSHSDKKFSLDNLMQSDDYGFLAEFGQALGFTDKKKSSDSQNGTDLLSNLLSVNKCTTKPIVEQLSKSKKKQEDPDNLHEYFKKALKPIKGTVEKPHLFTQKTENKEVAYQQKIKEAKNVLENKSKQKRYKPKVVDYLGVGQWSNFKKDGQDKPKPSRLQKDMKQKKSEKQKRIYSPQPEAHGRSQYKQKRGQKDREWSKQSRIVQEQRQQKFRIKQQQRQRQRYKQRQRQKARVQRERERSRENQRERIKQKQRQRQRQKQVDRAKKKQKQRMQQKESQRQSKRQREKRQRQREQRQHQRQQRQHQRQTRYKEHKKKKHQNQDDYQDDGFIVDDDEEQGQDWKKDLSKLLNKQKRKRIYRVRDQEDIAESSARQILGQDRISARFGRQQEQADRRREQEEKRKRAERKKRDHERKNH